MINQIWKRNLTSPEYFKDERPTRERWSIYLRARAHRVVLRGTRFLMHCVYLHDFARSFSERVIQSANAPATRTKPVESDVRRAEIGNKIAGTRQLAQ